MGDAATPILPDFTSQTAAVYKANIDAGFAVLDRLAWAFAPHEQAAPDMTVLLEAGALFDGSTLTEVAAQSTGTITAPSVDPRIDRVVIDNATGAVSVVTGVEDASPVPPAIPNGKLPVAQVLLATSTSEIANADITDERTVGTGGGGLRSVQVFTADDTWNKPAGITRVVIEVCGGGGGGGGAAASESGSGGAGGGYSKKLVDVSAISSETVTVGTGGAGGAAGNNNGSAGGTSSLGAHASATGGGGGTSTGGFDPGGAGGSGSSGDINLDGSAGGHSDGGAAVVGVGGNSFLGGGGLGDVQAAGGVGGDYGGGGGGGGGGTATARAGGDGADGVVIVWEYS
jgi:hypothetical protein